MVRHYTDDVGRERIEKMGLILLGREGRVYVTPDRYESPGTAAEKLALPRLPSGYFEIPEERLEGLSGPKTVQPRYGRPGGGLEQHMARPIDASNLKWVAISE